MNTVDLSDLSHSYPFLDLSRRLGVPYGAVLRASVFIDTNLSFKGYSLLGNIACWCKLPYEAVSAVCDICTAPWRWQFPPVGKGL